MRVKEDLFLTTRVGTDLIQRSGACAASRWIKLVNWS
jgi:hypothetical protein